MVLLRDLGELFRTDRCERLVRQAPQLAVEQVLALGNVLVALLALEPLADLLARLVGPDQRKPVSGWPVGGLGGDDLDDVAVVQPVVKRDQAVVDLGTNRSVADIGMNPVGKVERACSCRQILHVALGGEDEDLVLEEVELEPLHELRGVHHLALPIDQLSDPGELLVVPAVAARAFLVAPVRGDARLGDLVHMVGSDLNLERLGVGTDDRGVQALVHVRLGHGDVVVELPGYRTPEGVDDTEGGVTVLDVADQQPDGVQVVDLVELGALALHLLVDRVQVLGPA